MKQMYVTYFYVAYIAYEKHASDDRMHLPAHGSFISTFDSFYISYARYCNLQI